MFDAVELFGIRAELEPKSPELSYHIWSRKSSLFPLLTSCKLETKNINFISYLFLWCWGKNPGPHIYQARALYSATISAPKVLTLELSITSINLGHTYPVIWHERLHFPSLCVASLVFQESWSLPTLLFHVTQHPLTDSPVTSLHIVLDPITSNSNTSASLPLLRIGGAHVSFSCCA